jgi:hypothetical protein
MNGKLKFALAVFNNDTANTAQIISVLQKATNCSTVEAEIETWEIDYYGKCFVHFSDNEEELESMAKIIREFAEASVELQWEEENENPESS